MAHTGIFRVSELVFPACAGFGTVEMSCRWRVCVFQDVLEDTGRCLIVLLGWFACVQGLLWGSCHSDRRVDVVEHMERR